MEFFACLVGFVLLWILSRSIISMASAKAKRQPGDLPPGPPPLPIVGNLFLLRKNAHTSLARLAAVHGPIMTLKLGRVTTVVISSPDLARQVFQHHDLALAGRTTPDAAHALRFNELSIFWIPPTPLWRAYRRMCSTNLFTARSLDATAGLRRRKVDELLEFFRTRGRAGEAVNVGEALMVTGLNLLSNTILSLDLAELGSDRAAGFRELVGGMVEAVGSPNIANFFPCLGRLDLQGARRRCAMYLTKLFEIIDELVGQRLASGEHKGDVLDKILEATDERTGEHLIQRCHIRRLLADLFLAAMDTTSVTVEWAMAELLHNPSIMAKLRCEIREAVTGDRPISESDVSMLPYLQAVVKETFRFYPPAPLLVPRRAGEEVLMEGYSIPKGCQVLVNAWAIGRDPSVWSNPNEFVPERFVGSGVDVKGGDFVLIPFGAGRRICPGLPLALRMVHLLVASLVQQFEWELEGGMRGEEMDMEEDFCFMLHKAQPLHAIPVPL